MMKKILLDASSAILLYKAGLLDELTRFYRVYVSKTVLQELTLNNRPGADTIINRVSNCMITVIDLEDMSSRSITPLSATDSLDPGELDSIRCFEAGNIDLLIIDDGRAAKYCKEKGVPFVNALLFPRLLYFAKCLSLQESSDKMDDIIELGRYSAEIIKWARSCRQEALTFAIP